MLQMLCRNEVADWAKWKRVFDEYREDQEAAGLSLLQIWRETGAPQTVWLLFEVKDDARARAFMDDPKAEMHAERAGVTASAYHLVETA